MTKMINRLFFQQIDNSGLVVFRAIFGFLIAAEAFGAILTGWVKRVFIDPQFTFSFIGFEWLQPLEGFGMYYYFSLMGLFGIMVMLGFKYRLSIIAYALMWSIVYLMQKTSYNNHYYLLMLLLWMMCFVPANRRFSIDAKVNPGIKKHSIPRWCILIFIFQVWIVYTYAAIAKLYPFWLDGSMAEILTSGKEHYWLIGDLLQQNWVRWCITYIGIFFDLLIVPLLLWKRTRLAAFIFSIFFHLFNSAVFHIGIFPYMSISFALFFFSTKIINKRFLSSINHYESNELLIPPYRKAFYFVFTIYFLIQILLPLRHHLFKDKVLWTEEGHRLSWRMMLRTKSGTVNIKVMDLITEKKIPFEISEMLTPKQQLRLPVRPDFLWQFAQKIKTQFQKEGKEIAVYYDVFVSVNNGPYRRYIDPKTNMAAENWKHFKHHEWILPSPDYLN